MQEYTKRKIDSLTAKQKAFNSIKEDLDKEVQNYQAEYNKISNQIEKQAFGLALSSAIIGGITALTGPTLSAFSTSAAVSSVANNLIRNGKDPSAQKLEQQSQNYEDKNDKLYNQLEKIAQYKAEAEKARREVERELAEIVTNIANSTTVVNDLSVVCESLVMAIISMRFVKVYLSEIALFWKNVEQFCEKLTKEVQSLKENFTFCKRYSLSKLCIISHSVCMPSGLFTCRIIGRFFDLFL